MNRQMASAVVAPASARVPDSSAASLVLEVRQGCTAFPRRPVCHERFLIGGGTACHLRLGGEVPTLHSLIVREGADVRLETLVPVPPLVVNGRVCESVLLCDGDVIDIGPFRLVAHRAAAPPLYVMSDAPLVESDALDPAGLTAAELVGRIESEVHAIERFAARRQLGARALLESARLRAANQKPRTEDEPLRLLRGVEQPPEERLATAVDMVLPLPAGQDAANDLPSRAAA